MKKIKCLSLLMALCLAVTMTGAAFAQQETPGAQPITEQEFAALVSRVFPAYPATSALNTSQPLTFARALDTLCRALGMDGLTPAEALAFAIENGLISGIAVTEEGRVSADEARRMIDAFAACQREEEEQACDMAYGVVAAGGMQTSGASPAAEAANGKWVAPVLVPAPFPKMDYNSLNDESYGYAGENRFLNPADSPFSTFALDMDTASYANIRRCLLGGYWPDKGAIRIEEMLNYFDYDLPMGTQAEPVAVTTELNICPWNPDHRLAMVALSAYAPDKADLPGSNLVFLVDVSGSMEQSNRLPLARQALKLLLSQLSAKDTVTIVTYAGSVGTVLAPTTADEKQTIEQAIDNMRAGGSTNGAGGIEAAYAQAREAMIEGGNNRVILLTDGDFNVGVQSAAELRALIETERESGIYLSVLGFGMGNLKDYEMETLADTGNGNYAYIDTLQEAKKVLADDMTGTLFTIAKDVKLQIEFNPQKVAEYRLIGYENRMLETEDFTDDTKDAGEMGAGHQMIALYEIVPAAGTPAEPTAVSRYQETALTDSDELAYVSVRYQLPDSGSVVQTGSAIAAPQSAFGPMSADMAFASAVAEFGLLLLDSPYKADADMETLLARALANRAEDTFGYRAGFVQLVSLARLVALGNR